MNEQELERHLAAWVTSLDEDEGERQRRVADLLDRIMKGRPRQWGPGDVIPPNVDTVYGPGDRNWEKDWDPRSNSYVWTTAVTETELLTTFGPVGAAVASAANNHPSVTIPSDVVIGDRLTLAAALGLVRRAEKVLGYMSRKTGVHDRRACLGAANGCQRVAAALRDVVGEAES